MEPENAASLKLSLKAWDAERLALRVRLKELDRVAGEARARLREIAAHEGRNATLREKAERKRLTRLERNEAIAAKMLAELKKMK